MGWLSGLYKTRSFGKAALIETTRNNRKKFIGSIRELLQDILVLLKFQDKQAIKKANTMVKWL